MERLWCFSRKQEGPNWKGQTVFRLPNHSIFGEGNGTPLQYSCLENPIDREAWWAAVHGVAKSRTQLSDFTLTFHFHALEKEMATHSSVLAWRIPGTGETGGLPSMGSHRVGHDWSDLQQQQQQQQPLYFRSSLQRPHWTWPWLHSYYPRELELSVSFKGQVTSIARMFQWLSKHWNPLEGLVNHGLLGPIPRVSDSEGREDLACRRSSQVMLMLLDQGPPFKNSCVITPFERIRKL